MCVTGATKCLRAKCAPIWSIARPRGSAAKPARNSNDCKDSKLFVLTVATAVISGITGQRGATAQSASATNVQSGAIVTAMQAFLNSLDPAQREKVTFTYTPQKTASAARLSRSDIGRGRAGSGGPQGGAGRPGSPGGG